MKEKNTGKANASSDSSVLESLGRISDKLKGLSDKVERIPGKKPEFIVVALYSICHFLMLAVHEPWFDEALAWLIAKDSTVYELLFEIPHYEGHPALWHLFLMPFAKLGAPYEISLSLVTFIFAGGAIALFVFKSAFPRIIRLLAPFTYFMFYQFGVVSRPYCMMMLAFFLLAVFYGRRNEKPGRYVISLLFLCATSAYGIVMAGGLTIAWIVELWMESGNKKQDKQMKQRVTTFWKSLCEHGKIGWLCFLLIYALFVIWRILPAEDTYASAMSDGSEKTGLALRLIYMVFGSTADSFITNTFSSESVLNSANIGTVELIGSVLIGAGILFLMVRAGRRRHMLLSLCIPYLLTTVFMALVYASRHHIGIIYLFIMFWLWTVLDEAGKDENPGEKKNINPYGVIIPLVAAVCMLIPLYWSISSAIIDVFQPYSWGRDEARFLKENDLTGRTILAQWEGMPGINGESSNAITFCSRVTYLLPYLDEDNFLNSIHQMDEGFGMLHKIPERALTEQLIENIRADEVPDIVTGNVSYYSIYGADGIDMNDYVCVHSEQAGLIWKGVPEPVNNKIFVKKELAEEKKLKVIGK